MLHSSYIFAEKSQSVVIYFFPSFVDGVTMCDWLFKNCTWRCSFGILNCLMLRHVMGGSYPKNLPMCWSYLFWPHKMWWTTGRVVVIVYFDVANWCRPRIRWSPLIATKMMAQSKLYNLDINTCLSTTMWIIIIP